MSSGKCFLCGKDNLKNIEVHMRYCKNRAMKQETSFSQSPTKPAEPITSIPKKSILERIFNRGKRPIIIKSSDKNYSDAGLTEQQRYLISLRMRRFGQSISQQA